MSNSDLEDVPHTGWFDSESDFPEISSLDSTLELRVNVSYPSANPIHVRAPRIEDSSAVGSVRNKGSPVGHAALEETESYKGVNLINTPIHTPPQSKSQFTFFVSPWVSEG